MKTIWLSYAWADNKDGDVEFVAQELLSYGLNVKIDKWNISAGKRLWDQIQNFICNKDECDGWLLYATSNSLNSEACKEEFAYALDTALTNRGASFPIIGLFPSGMDMELIPAGIRTRLYVSLNDEDWKERIKSTIEGKLPNISNTTLNPYTINLHNLEVDNKTFKVIEIRPRAGSWTPSFVGIPLSEKDRVDPGTKYGPKGIFNEGGIKTFGMQSPSIDNEWWIMSASNEVTNTISMYLICLELPSKIVFGKRDSEPQFFVDIKQK